MTSKIVNKTRMTSEIGRKRGGKKRKRREKKGRQTRKEIKIYKHNYPPKGKLVHNINET